MPDIAIQMLREAQNIVFFCYWADFFGLNRVEEKAWTPMKWFVNDQVRWIE